MGAVGCSPTRPCSRASPSGRRLMAKDVGPTCAHAGMNQTFLVAAFLVLEVWAVLYLSLLAFVLSGWMVSDHVALEMSDADWLLAGSVRFGEWCLVAAVFSVVLAWLHRRLGVAAGSRIFRWLPFVWFMLIVIASGVGASKFFVERPYM